MEITFEEPYDDIADPFQDPYKNRILLSLNSEKLNRKPLNIPDERQKNLYNDSLLSPLSIYEENHPHEQPQAQYYKTPLSNNTSSRHNSSQKPRNTSDSMHNQLKKPDFNQISQIYSAYSHINEHVAVQRKSLSKTPPVSRPASAPLTRKNIVQDLIKERENEFKKSCTFKPKINRNSIISQKNNELTVEQKILKLSRPKSELHEKREKLKRELEDMKCSECTFKPNITPYRGSTKSFSEYPVDERLYQDAEAKYQERERLQRERQDEIAANYPFRPQVQATSNKLVGNKKDKPPIYQRLDEVQKEMMQNRNSIRLEAEQNDPDLTFKPKINRNSYMLAHSKRQRNSSANDNKCLQYHKHSAQLSFEDKYTFTPNIVSTTSTSSTKDFLERQKVFQEKSRLRKEENADRLQQRECNFTPEIDRTSKYIAESNENRTREKLEVRLMRDHEKSRENKVMLAEKYYSNFTYEPAINQISKTIAKSSSLSDISSNAFTLAMKKKLAEDKALDEERKNSFTPKITKTKKFEYVTSAYKQGDNLANTIREKFKMIEKKREEVKKIQEFEEMRECTFTPHHVARNSYSESRAQIKGIERFLELKNIAKKREEEAKERESKVFIHNPKDRGESYYTVPRPFNLHPSNKKQKIEKIREQLMKKEQDECVFQPKIKE